MYKLSTTVVPTGLSVLLTAMSPKKLGSLGSLRHGLSDRLLRTGTLIIESASQDPLEFHDIPRVERVHSLLYHEVFDTLGSEESPS